MFKNNPIKDLPTSEGILNILSDQEIFEYYLNRAIPIRPICSPLRNDKIPSFSLFFSDKYGKILFHDFATGEKGDVFVFIKRLFNLHAMVEVFNKIAIDFNLTQFSLNSNLHFAKVPKRIVRKNKKILKQKNKITIKIVIREWSNIDKEYWFDKYGLNIKQLEYCNVYPITHYYLNDYCKKTDEIAYAFVENKDGNQTYKIYQPFNKENKWINNNDYSVWELWNQLPSYGHTLIIGSSRKDSMVIKSLFHSGEVTSCALQAEGVLPKEHVIDQLKSRFNHIYVLYDNDFDKTKNWGYIAGKKIADKFRVKQLVIPKQFNINDIAEFREVHGKGKTRKLINLLMKNVKEKKIS